MNKLEEFRKIKTDENRWKWLLENQGQGLVVMLDNDYTFVVDSNDYDADSVGFDEYLGWSDGVVALLRTVGIACDVV